ncbi:MAG: hypothetical protein K0V04_26740, partial [Deltaproteobacteria bacterium]|nr:hypothetical protein [Deltaproteobacteria bacterium]
WSFVRVLADRLRHTTADLATARAAASMVPDLTELAEEAARSAARMPVIDPAELAEDLDLDKRPTLIPSTVIAPAPKAGSAPVPAAVANARPTLISTTTNNVAPAHTEPATPVRPPSGPRPTASPGAPTGSDASTRPRSAPVDISPPPQPRPDSSPRVAAHRTPTGPIITGDTVAPPGGLPPSSTPGGTMIGPAPPSPVSTGDTVVPPSSQGSQISGPTATTPATGRRAAPRRDTQSMAFVVSPERDSPSQPAARTVTAAPAASPSGATRTPTGPRPAPPPAPNPAPSSDGRTTRTGMPASPQVPPPPPTSSSRKTGARPAAETKPATPPPPPPPPSSPDSD